MLTFSLILLALLGLCVGSFLNAAVYRVAHKRKLGNDRSICPHCKHVLAAADLVPVLSYLALGGKCRYCHKKISPQYPLVEGITAIVFVLSGVTRSFVDLANPQLNFALLQLLTLLIFEGFLLFVALYDIRYGLILNKVIAPFYLIGILGALVLQYPLTSILAGAGVGAVFFGVLYFVSHGTWIGAGDVKFAPLLGIMVGFPGILLALFVAYVGGALVSLFLIAAKRRKKTDRIPFAGFLVAGGLVALLFGSQIINYYLNFLG